MQFVSLCDKTTPSSSHSRLNGASPGSSWAPCACSRPSRPRRTSMAGDSGAPNENKQLAGWGQAQTCHKVRINAQEPLLECGRSSRRRSMPPFYYHEKNDSRMCAVSPATRSTTLVRSSCPTSYRNVNSVHSVLVHIFLFALYTYDSYDRCVYTMSVLGDE